METWGRHELEHKNELMIDSCVANIMSHVSEVKWAELADYLEDTWQLMLGSGIHPGSVLKASVWAETRPQKLLYFPINSAPTVSESNMALNDIIFGYKVIKVEWNRIFHFPSSLNKSTNTPRRLHPTPALHSPDLEPRASRYQCVSAYLHGDRPWRRYSDSVPCSSLTPGW